MLFSYNKLGRVLAAFALSSVLYSCCCACGKEEKPIIPLYPQGGDGSESTVEGEILITNQSPNSIMIVEAATGKTTWSWSPTESGLTAAEQAWFGLLDEAKPIYCCEYVLVTGTRGGVAIIRISDKKIMFYARPGGSPHSAELLPDGNVVVASSSGSSQSEMENYNKLKLYAVDFDKPYAEKPIAEYPLYYGHNAVYDIANQCLWATADDVLNRYTYKVENGVPGLTLTDTYSLPSGQSGAHDMYPVYGANQLWITTTGGIYQFDVSAKTFTRYSGALYNTNIKSISSGPSNYDIIMLSPQESWWSDRVINVMGKAIYQSGGAQIYKARWMIENTFSYPQDHKPQL